MRLPINLNPHPGQRLVSDCWVSAPSVPWAGWNFEGGAIPSGAHHVRALWDTGSGKTYIQRRIAERCQLQPIEAFMVGSFWRADVSVEPSFDVNLGLPGGIVVSRLRVMSWDIFDEIDVVIGMDIILRVGLTVVADPAWEPLVRFHGPLVESPAPRLEEMAAAVKRLGNP